MAYHVVNGRLYYENRQGTGPCRARLRGAAYRRHIRLAGMPEGHTYHVTKGRVFRPRQQKEA